MKVSISLGGSLLTRPPELENYRMYAESLRRLYDLGHTLMVVCGGGRSARKYIEIARNLGGSWEVQDKLGILASHMNGLLLISALGEDADSHIYRRGSDINRWGKDKIMVGGGHMPGSSTDYRAVIFARAMNADLVVNATDYGGIFDKDPSKYDDARKYGELTYDELKSIIKERFKQEPGDYGLFDLKGLKLAKRIKVPIVFIDGADPEEIMHAVEGGHSGTLVRE